MLPRAGGIQTGEEREAPARIFSPSGRAELWSAGNTTTDKEKDETQPVPVEQA
jgi:hypothetical protein